MGLFDFLRPRPKTPLARRWTAAKDVAVFADADAGSRLERELARHGISARVFHGPQGRAIEMLIRFVPSVVLIRVDQIEAAAVLEAMADAHDLGQVPVLFVSPGRGLPELESLLGERPGGLICETNPEVLSRALAELAPELLS